MKRQKKIHYSEADKALMWDRWQAGDSLHSIAQLFDRHHPSIKAVLARTGGVRPAVRRRSRSALTLAEHQPIPLQREADVGGFLAERHLYRAKNPCAACQAVQPNPSCRSTLRIEHLAGIRVWRAPVEAHVIDIDPHTHDAPVHSGLLFAMLLSRHEIAISNASPQGSRGASISSIRTAVSQPCHCVTHQGGAKRLRFTLTLCTMIMEKKAEQIFSTLVFPIRITKLIPI